MGNTILENELLDYDGMIKLCYNLGIIFDNDPEDRRCNLSGDDKLDILLKMLAETEELNLENDELSDMITKSPDEELNEDILPYVSAAGSSEFERFLNQLNKPSKDIKEEN